MLNCTPMTNFDRILAEARELLTEEERRRLSLELVPDEGALDPGIEAAWMEEEKRRFAEHDAGKAKSVPWAEARERIFAKP